jgi:hypothetical protein
MTELENLKDKSILDDPSKMGLDPSCIVECWPSNRGLTYREIFQGLRNALSHPGTQKLNRSPITGFTSIESVSGVIEVFEFTHSPWVNLNGNPKISDYEKLYKDMTSFASDHKIIGLEMSKNIRELWEVQHEGKPFIPVLRLRINLKQLRTLTLTLSDVLSESLTKTAELQAA